jgi:type II secretory pathway pseudopilin PulG
MKPKRPLISPSHSEAGFTIIESLLAVIVVGILIVAIGPVIALSAATRIQARRVDWATQAARAYLDGVRSGVIAPPPIASTSDTKKNLHVTTLQNVVPPTPNTLNCSARTVRTDNGAAIDYNDSRSGYCQAPKADPQYVVYCVDGDNNGTCTTDSLRDFLVQASGLQYATTTTDATRGYLLGIRVYRADGFGDGTVLKTDEQARTFSGGLGDRKAPVLITITEIIGSGTTYQDLQNQYQ